MEETRTETTEPGMAKAGNAEPVTAGPVIAGPGSVLAHRILDDLSEIIAECELLLPNLAPVYTMSKRVRNIRRLAGQLATDIAAEQCSAG